MHKINIVIIILVFLINISPTYVKPISLIPGFKIVNNLMPINNDDNFLQTAVNQSWIGKGTSNSPIIISNLADYFPLQLQIYNTNLYFEISNNNFDIRLADNFYTSHMYFENVSNGLIQNNTFSGNSDAAFIFLTNCSNFQIRKNIFGFSGTSSLSLSDSKNIVITNNRIENQIYGIQSDYSYLNQNITFNDNSVSTQLGIQIYSNGGEIRNNDFGNAGLQLTVTFFEIIKYMEFSNNTLNDLPIMVIINQSNKVLNKNYGEILLINSTNIIIENQLFTNKYQDLGIYYCNNITVEKSTFLNLRSNLAVFKTNNSFISHNNLTNTSISIIFSKNDILDGNKLMLADIYIHRGEILQIINNIIANSTQDGIQIQLTNTSLIENNIIYNSKYDGIYLYNSNFDNISSNEIYNNGQYGINVYESINNTIENNEIYNNKNEGINWASKNGEQNNIEKNNNIYNNNGEINNGIVEYFLFIAVIIVMTGTVVIIGFKKKETIRLYTQRYQSRNRKTIEINEDSKLICKICGTIIDDTNSIFCSTCGEKI